MSDVAPSAPDRRASPPPRGAAGALGAEPEAAARAERDGAAGGATAADGLRGAVSDANSVDDQEPARDAPEPADPSEADGEEEVAPSRDEPERPRSARSRDAAGGSDEILDEAECLRRLSRLAEAAASGMIAPAAANASRAALETILRYHQHQRQRGRPAAGGVPGLIRLAEERPELQPLLEPYLDRNEISAALAEAAREDDDG